MRFGSATPLRLLPEWNLDKLNFWSQIVFAFGGLELGAIMGGEIRNPEKTVARAAWIAGAEHRGVLHRGHAGHAGAAAAGSSQRRDGFGAGRGRCRSAPGNRLAAAGAGVCDLVWRVTGQLGAWIAGSARLPFVIGIDHYLPPIFSRLHPRWRTPHLSILILSGACTVFVIAMQAGENLRIGYQLLVDMTVMTYFVPFLYLFGAAWKNGQRVSAMAGLAVTTLAILLSFVPPPDVSSVWVFEGKLGGGFLLLAAGARACFRRYQGEQE